MLNAGTTNIPVEQKRQVIVTVYFHSEVQIHFDTFFLMDIILYSLILTVFCSWAVWEKDTSSICRLQSPSFSSWLLELIEEKSYVYRVML